MACTTYRSFWRFPLRSNHVSVSTLPTSKKSNYKNRSLRFPNPYRNLTGRPVLMSPANPTKTPNVPTATVQLSSRSRRKSGSSKTTLESWLTLLIPTAALKLITFLEITSSQLILGFSASLPNSNIELLWRRSWKLETVLNVPLPSLLPMKA